MRHLYFIITALLLHTVTSFAQPRYSPEIRAQREAQWMTDSLHINSAQSAKVHDLFLLYNQQMDKASLLPAKQKNKEQQVLMNKKDKDLKKILNKQQYQQYYRFEKEVRKRAKVTHTGPHKPM